jgi:deoxycytidine triphosphate deaminase
LNPNQANGIISNKRLIELVNQRQISIKPFRSGAAQLAHYPLYARSFLKRENDGRWQPSKTFTYDTTGRSDFFEFGANEYVVVEAQEHISLEKGYVGLFCPPSNLIEAGFALTAGKISHPFGQSNESIRFGLKNQLAIPNRFHLNDILAYVYFFDLTNIEFDQYRQSDRDLKVFESRRARAEDDGVYAVVDQIPI